VPVGHPQAEGQLLVVREAHGRHGEAGRLERDAVRILAQHEDVVEARTEAELPAEHPERPFAAGWYPELRRRRVAVHHREDEGLYMLEGEIRFRRGADEFVAGPGSLVWGVGGRKSRFGPGLDCWCRRA